MAVPHPEEEREGVTVTVVDSVPLPVAHAQGVALADTVPVGPPWVPLPHPDTVALKVMDALGLSVPVPQCVEVGHADAEEEPVADRVPVGVMDKVRVLQLEGVKEGEGEVLPHPVQLAHPDADFAPLAVALKEGVRVGVWVGAGEAVPSPTLPEPVEDMLCVTVMLRVGEEVKDMVGVELLEPLPNPAIALPVVVVERVRVGVRVREARAVWVTPLGELL